MLIIFILQEFPWLVKPGGFIPRGSFTLCNTCNFRKSLRAKGSSSKGVLTASTAGLNGAIMWGRSLPLCMQKVPLPLRLMEVFLSPFKVLLALLKTQLTSWAISTSIQDSLETVNSYWHHQASEAQMQSCLQIYLRAKHKKPRKMIRKLCRGMPMPICISKG